MAGSGDREGTPLARIKAALEDLPGWLSTLDGSALGEPLIEIRAVIDRSEAVFAEVVCRVDKSREYKADGALSLTAWLRWKCKLSGGAALERVEIARQLEKLPQTEAAFAIGALGYQHVAVLARAAEHVGAAAVRKEEGTLLQAAQTMDPGQFVTVAKNFEHRVDAAGALAEANHAYQRRYFHIGEPVDGLVRLDGVLDAEGGATLRAALQPFLKPLKDDDRSYGQRSADALVELGRQGSGSKRNGAGPRPQLIIRASLDTLAGSEGAPAGELVGGGTVPAETVQRFACDSAITDHRAG
ncbi:MAG: 13E12 repeat family protein [Candidatus Dormibacteraeota bacterium]|nr:13E12 repeat family protein [Candidatus Dormibacteraeota bacterium]